MPGSRSSCLTPAFRLAQRRDFSVALVGLDGIGYCPVGGCIQTACQPDKGYQRLGVGLRVLGEVIEDLDILAPYLDDFHLAVQFEQRCGKSCTYPSLQNVNGLAS